ncbi:50S ribosomal protein L20 [Acholeplasma oculi]|uniref:Large ribosomal subunit protein bL20 n=1 Tax=Acholeplasma oculi TaxID=35623 RepID=A0A061AAU7_9MOLU|nr:50S ribosomal protein L20 [Acholeplasma oculi]SKC36413.1 LSU ribosomal protein L20P [Acholeplasma oculi]SUT90504.1 50S ribosomal protein L20 [Acholeplasma oculi]
MARVKGGIVTRKRRKKILKLAEGYFGSKHTLYRTAREQVLHSLMYAYRDRKQNKRNFRRLWIARINAAAVANGFKYSKLVHGLSLANVQLNRKVLADIAVTEPTVFTSYVELAKDAIANPAKFQVKQEVVAKAEKVVVEKAPKAKVEAVVDTKALEVELSKMLVADLRPIAIDKGIENAKSLKKQELVEALAKIGYNPAN